MNFAALRYALPLVLALLSTACVAGDSKPFSIRLERNGCFGSCPYYVVTVSSDGSVLWEGKEYVRVKGTRTSTIGLAGVKAIREKLDTLPWATFKNEYPPEVTDGPRERTVIKQGGKTKDIYSEGTTPVGLTELQDLIDRVCKTQQWIFITREVLEELWWKDAEIRYKAADFLEEAIGWNDGDLIRSLARKGANVNGRTKHEKRPYLVEAVRADHPLAVEALLDVGADPNASSDLYAKHVFVYAALRTESPTLVLRSFLQRGMPVDLETEDGETALIAAARWMRVENVIYLVEQKANVNYRSRKGATPLLAVSQGLADMKNNFSFCKKPMDESTAKNCNEWLGAAQLRHDKIRQYLLSHGAVEESK